jgi:hypothetical protein
LFADQFSEVVRRREREAIEASLPRYLTVFDARPPGAIAIGNDWTRRLFDGDFYVSPPPDHQVGGAILRVAAHVGGDRSGNRRDAVRHRVWRGRDDWRLRSKQRHEQGKREENQD